MLANARGALVAIQARDFERAVTFYAAVLGLEMTFRHESYWAEFRAPGLTLGVGAAGDATVVGGGATSICFEVANIEAVVEALRSRGVSFVGPIVEKFHGKEASFVDSEGNPLLLHQSSAAAPAAEKRAATGARRAAPKDARKKGASSGAKRSAPRRPAPKSASAKKPRGPSARRGRGKRGRR